ncbi:MAG: PAS domain S-box protein [Lachnospiraceae bacterium]|nr:PAS domain S-box protein [Lachnospiraceae bacterium]
MNDMLKNMDEVLNRQICGFHQYVLEEPVHISYVSENLCELLGVHKEELSDSLRDVYEEFVHPADRSGYREVLKKLSDAEQNLTAEYRIVREDGQVLYIRDALTSKKTREGVMVATSVLTDITDIKNINSDMQFFNDSIPCGFLRYTCEKQPRVTYMNARMAKLMRFPEARDGEIDYQEMYKSNVFLMIPMEERRRFSKYLNRVYSADTPVAGDMTLLRCDGTRAHVFGWVAKIVGENGEEEFQSVCMDVTERYQTRKSAQTKRYIKALADVYDKVFEFNLDANTVKCLHCADDSYFKSFENLGMQIGDALESWLVAQTEPENQAQIRKFFMDFCQKRLYDGSGKPPQITYRAKSHDGTVKQYRGMFIRVDDAVSFYCCRELKNTEDARLLKEENNLLKEKMRDIIVQFSDGLAAFEVNPDGGVKPLYASENICEFFGYSKEEWLPLTQCYTPIDKFVAYSEASYDDFAQLLAKGEAEFSYFDYKTETEHTIKAICSTKEQSQGSPRYVMLYKVDKGEKETKKSLPEKRIVSIRTFGYFDVFVGDSPIAFRNKKSKELFALLVDRKGGFVSSEEAIGFLWEDEPVSALTLSRYRKVALRLKSTLEEYGIAGIVESVDGKRRIVMDKVDCDLYNYLSGKSEYAQLFKGSYLTNYSWGEMTLGELIGNQE